MITVHDIGLIGNSNTSDGQVGSGNEFVFRTRLPRLEIKRFSGDITKRQTFLYQFQAAVDKTTLPKVNKFTYPKSLLEGRLSI